MLHAGVVERIKKYVPCSINFFNRAVYEIMQKNKGEPNRPQMTRWRMRIACSILNATSTHSKHEILILFPLKERFQTVLCYTYIACLVGILIIIIVKAYFIIKI